MMGNDMTDCAGSIDRLIFETDIFSSEFGSCDLTEISRSFFDHHYNGNAVFARLVDRSKGVDPERPYTYPAIPTSVFKSLDLFSIPADEIELWSTSSGTSGTISRVARDRITLDRLLGNLDAGLRLLGDWHEDEIEIVHLGPSHENAGNVWFAYVMSLAELLHPCTSFAQRGIIDFAAAHRRVMDALADNVEIALIGAPFAIFDFCNYARSLSGCEASDRLTVMTAGGWKRRNGERFAPDGFRRFVQETWNLASDTQIRDAFNQVELNSVAFECEFHRKHLPPWLFAQVRSPYTLEPLEDGATGLLSYVDLSVTSYPCSILADDLGRVSGDACPCGRPGRLLSIERRVERGFARGCAHTLEADFTA